MFERVDYSRYVGRPLAVVPFEQSMSGKWFANKGQIIQAIAAVVSACVALVALYFVLKSNNSLPKASAVLYVSTGVLLLLVGIWIGRRTRSASLPAPLPPSE
jgi:hypothetical protein